MSKLHLVLVLATAHFLPVGISTPNLTRAAAVLILFILFYFFPLIFLAFYLYCPKIIFTFFLPEQKWPPEGSFLRRRAIGKALRRKRSAESTSQLLTALSKDLHVIWKKSKGYGRRKMGIYENIPKLYFSHHPRNILLCPDKCNIKKGTVAHWQITTINPITFVRDQGFVRLFSSLVISLHLFVQHCGWLTMRKPGVAADSTCTFEGFTIHMGRTKTHKTFQYQRWYHRNARSLLYWVIVIHIFLSCAHWYKV